MKIPPITKFTLPKAIKRTAQVALLSAPVIGGLESCSLVFYDPFFRLTPPPPVYRHEPPIHYNPHRYDRPHRRFCQNYLENNDILDLSSANALD